MKEKNLEELLERVEPDRRLSLLQASILLKEALFLDQAAAMKRYFSYGFIVGFVICAILFLSVHFFLGVL